MVHLWIRTVDRERPRSRGNKSRTPLLRLPLTDRKLHASVAVAPKRRQEQFADSPFNPSNNPFKSGGKLFDFGVLLRRAKPLADEVFCRSEQKFLVAALAVRMIAIK